ncbi:MAG: GWxTD domain-containing protein [Bacteroidetes bacterium]|nr:GWxTD domain-containing protein [Bacteroidota bacterium]MCH8522947.1 GWxTD domain-containing protein [Balneolales bacterium]
MKIYQSVWLITIIVLTGFSQTLQSQSRYTYQMLLNQNRDSHVHFDFIYQPAADGNTEVIILHRVQHPFLNFRRQLIQGQERTTTQFTSDLAITFDFYSGDSDPVPSEPFIARETWSSTITVAEFEDTQNAELYLSGVTKFTLPPDTYRLIPTISINGREVTGARAAAIQQGRQPSQPVATPRGRRAAREAREAQQRRGLVEIPDLNTGSFARITLLERDQEPLVARNHGRNVSFGEDFSVLLSVPSEMQQDSLEIRLFEIGAIPSSENRGNTVWNAFIQPDYNTNKGNIRFHASSSTSEIEIHFNDSSELRHHTIQIPNHRFANAWFRAEVYKWNDGESEKIGETTWQSRWFNMPTSLLNLDVAIDMLRFIVSSDELRQVRRSSQQEREEWFRDFWEQRNPTPDTKFNELMAEYYRRIDFAYREFSTPSRAGFDSDQGRTYIVNGPPDNIERRLPPGGVATEVWTYPNQTIIFRATTGFGDFQLVNPTN